MVRALPREEWAASASANSAQPRGFLFWNWTRAGPAAYRSATFAAPSAANAAAGYHRGQNPLRVPERQVQGGEAAHREADHVRPPDLEAVEHGDRVRHRALLGVRLRVGGHVRRRVAAGRVGDAAIGPREEPHLRLPAAVVAGELVDEQERLALTGLLGMQLHAVVGHDRWHRGSPSLAGLVWLRCPYPDTSFTGSAPMMC
jgi:hypothetical protein